MRIAMSSGHGKYIRGASGYPVPPQLDEVDEARRVVDRTAEILNSMDGVECETFHDNTSYDQSTNLSTITNWHNNTAFNGANHELDISVHFNAYDGSAHGTEVLYVTQETLAAITSERIADAAGFTNRGAKYRNDLYVLNNTQAPAILIETCFCDNTSDSTKYEEAFEEICTAIAEAVTGQESTEEPEQPPEVERPPEPEPPELTGRNRVYITAKTKDDVSVTLNDTLVYGHERCEHQIDFTLNVDGDVTVVINGEEFHNKRREGT